MSIMLALFESVIKGLARLVNLPLPKLGRGPPAAWQGPNIKIPEIQTSRLPKAYHRTHSKAPDQRCKSSDLINRRDGQGHPPIT